MENYGLLELLRSAGALFDGSGGSGVFKEYENGNNDRRV